MGQDQYLGSRVIDQETILKVGLLQTLRSMKRLDGDYEMNRNSIFKDKLEAIPIPSPILRFNIWTALMQLERGLTL